MIIIVMFEQYHHIFGASGHWEDPCGWIRRLSWPVDSVNHHPLQTTCRSHHQSINHDDIMIVIINNIIYIM